MILIIDFGSQFSQLIARHIRECKIYSRIEPSSISINKIKEIKPNGIILSGGPSNIYNNKTQKTDINIFNLKIPILGICYGMHFIVDSLGGKIENSKKREYGSALMTINSTSTIFKKIKKKTTVWMSHEDSVKNIPSNFTVDGFTTNTKIAAISNEKEKIYGLQFHPEVKHTVDGNKIIDNFLFNICHCKPNWQIKTFIHETIKEIQKKVGNENVILGLSGGVDSTVTALILEKAIGKQLTCIFIDNGLLRKNENLRLKIKLRKHLKCTIKFISAKNKFIKALAKITSPEKKRKIIGKIFVEIFDIEAKKIKNTKYLAQGTLYPDVIESHSVFGSQTSLIKSHHNVGGLPNNMKLKLIEPLKYLFKDEVRHIGAKMGLDDNMLWRQPFPGPGLAIRIIGEITQKKLSILRNADAILQEEITNSGYYKKLWQSFAILLPVKSVGIMGDKRTYENIAGIRAVTSSDAMTADWARLPHDLLAKISNRIINEVKGINRVMYDISSKPPSTIELE